MENNKKAKKHKSESIARLRKTAPPDVKLAVKAKMTLAAHIADLITAKGWSKSEFARHVNQEPSVITKWLSGTHNFTQDTLGKIAAVLDINSVEELYEAKKLNEIVDVAIVGEEKQDDGFKEPSDVRKHETHMKIIHIKRDKLILKPSLTGS